MTDHAHFLNRPLALPNWFNEFFPEPPTQPSDPCDHEYSGFNQFQILEREFGTSNGNPYTREWTDSLERSSIETTIVQNDPKITTHTIRLIDGTPVNASAQTLAYMPLAPSCPSPKEYRIEATITGKVEIVNPGFERLRFYYCPPFDKGERTSAGYARGIRVQGINGRSYIARWDRTHTASSNKIEAGGYNPGNFQPNATGSGSGQQYQISDWFMQSQLWDEIDPSDPVDRDTAFDEINGTLVSDDGTENHITIESLPTCPGFIAIHADTADTLWQVNGEIFYEIGMTIYEIDD